MTTKEIKQAYRDAVSMEPAWSGNQRMIDYICKRADEVVVLENGDMVAIEKPDIKKNFCFGYGSWGPTYEEALEDARNARENYDYFMDKNLEQIDRIIREYLEYTPDGNNRYTKFICGEYTGHSAETRVKAVTDIDEYRESTERVQSYLDNGAYRLTEGDRKRMLAGYAKVRERFLKRLVQYLNRYGLSKLHVWTYWQDE